MVKLINVSDELQKLSKEILESIEEEDKEYNFKKNKSYVERNVPASKFRNNLIGLRNHEIGKIISEQNIKQYTTGGE